MNGAGLLPVPPGTAPPLDAAAARAPEPLRALRERTPALTDRLRDLQSALYADGRRGVLVVLQGRDASGKDGAIRRVFGAIDPQGLVTHSFGAPTELELRHDFLWRVHAAVGPRGVVTVFNRSHYEDVLVVRVRGLAPEAVWRPRYRQIADFERLLVETGWSVVKFFLHVSPGEQRQRLEERLADPAKNWKFRAGDLDDRALWDDYTAAYAEAIERTGTPEAPWYVVPADEKKVRDALIADVMVRTLEALPLAFPPADPAVLALRGTIR